MKRFFMILLALGSSLFAAEKPNVIVILSDDLGWGSVGCYGANPELVSTPNIDRLAQEKAAASRMRTRPRPCARPHVIP